MTAIRNKEQKKKKKKKKSEEQSYSFDMETNLHH